MPESLTEQLLGPLQPDENALTPLFQANVDEFMLREITAADYDWMADECYALLQPILNAGLVAADDFNLREVLELIRRSKPDDPEWGPGGYGQRGHWMRLFACTALVRFAPTRRGFVRRRKQYVRTVDFKSDRTVAACGESCREYARVAFLNLSRK